MCVRYLDTFRITESRCSVARHRPGTGDFDCLIYSIVKYVMQLLTL